MPVRALVDECPLYDLEPVKPTRTPYPAPEALLPQNPPRGDAAGACDESARRGWTGGELLRALLSSPNIASRRPLFEQYDAIVQSRTVRRPEQADAAVLQLPNGSALGVSIDCNGRRVAADPYTGTVGAVLECASNLACVGARPLGTTNNLNFGNPEKGLVAWQLSEAVRGLGDACRALQAPIVGGNVSLYNESPPTRASAGPIYPTPVIGMVGELPDARRAGRLGFARAGDALAIAGPFEPSLAASELAKLWGWELPDGLPPIDVAEVASAQAAIRVAVRSGAVSSAHDIAEGGLAVALAECCLAGELGARVSLGTDFFGAELAGATGRGGIWSGISPAPAAAPTFVDRLFGEGSGAFVVSGGEDELRALAERTSVLIVGTVGGGSLRIDLGGEGEAIELTLAEMAHAHDALAELFV
jgi:phosphoribosylformylglycinamidine synthase